jgi:hypothetical protein
VKHDKRRLTRLTAAGMAVMHLAFGDVHKPPNNLN